MSAASPQVLVNIIGTPPELGHRFNIAMSNLNTPKLKILWKCLPIQNSYSDSYLISAHKNLFNYVFPNSLSNKDKANTGTKVEKVLSLFFVKHEDSHLIVEKYFGIETFVAPLDFNIYDLLGDLTPAKLGQYINTIARIIKKRIRQFEKAAYSLKVELLSRANSTPLLLPFDHFEKKKMEKLRECVQTIIDSDNPDGMLKSITTGFEQQNPKQTHSADKKKYFQNSSGLVFKPPGRHLHGYLRMTSKQKHPHFCYTRAYLRFGVAIKPNFHFDCVNKRGTVLQSVWSSCHGQVSRLPPGRNHINIAPNNHTR